MSECNENTGTVTAQGTGMRWFRLALWLALIALALWFLTKIVATIVIFILAAFITYLLSPLMYGLEGRWKFFEKRPLPRWLSITVIYLLILATCAGLIFYIVPPLIHQFNTLTSEIPTGTNGLTNIINRLTEKYRQFPMPEIIKDRYNDLTAGLLSRSGEFLGFIGKAFLKFFMTLFSWLILLSSAMLVSLFMMIGLDRIKERFPEYIPRDYRNDANDLLLQVHKIFGGFIKGNIILSVAISIVTYIILTIMGFFSAPFNYALSVSIVAGLLYVIPYLGITISGVMGGLLGYMQTHNWGYALAVFLIVIIINNLIDQVMRPKVMADALNMNSIFILFAAFAGAEIMGILGMIIGIPIAAMIIAILTYIYNKFLAEEEEEQGTAEPGTGRT
ncbi:MAG: AI-2E family transporter [Chloroflexi bacterium]|nr:AI-2E family transporter [Chloroflexota bacterium]